MESQRFSHDLCDGDIPLMMAPPPPPETPCEVERNGSSPIRLQPSASHSGSSIETDRIINYWRPRIFNLVEQSISMARDISNDISWNGTDELFPCCPYLKLLKATSNDMRHFTDEVCHLLLQISTREEILDAYWFDGRAPDARDAIEWLERWGLWLPDQEGQFRFWSIFLPCESLEALYRYAFSLVHDYYIEILEMHVIWEEEKEKSGDSSHPLLPPTWEGIKEFQWIPPRLIVESGEIWLSQENANELREWGMIAFGAWKFSLTELQKEALYDLVHEADRLCPDPRFADE